MIQTTPSILEDRVTTGRFDPSFTLADADIHELVRLATKAPSAFNLQNWHFIAVRSKRNKELLRSVSYGQRQVSEAAVTFIVCGLTNSHLTLFETLQPSVDAGLLTPSLQKTWSEMAIASHESNPRLQRDEAIRSATFAAMCLLVAAKEMGLAAGVLGGFEPEKLHNVFGLESNELPVVLLTVGKQAEGNWPSKMRKPVKQVLTYR